MEQKRDLSQQQIIQAANAGLQLLNTPGAVNVPGPMAVSGVTGALYNLLSAIATQEVVVINTPPTLDQAPTPPDGDGEKKPDLKSVSKEKTAEK
jgi:hypothetical protein